MVLTVIFCFSALFSVFAGPIEDLQPGHWAAISLNTIKDMDPCPARNCSYSCTEGQSGVINDWCGGAFATGFGAKGGFIVWGGGHGGYCGNEIYVFDLASRLWKRHTEPSNYGNTSCSGATGAYPDGRPCPPHTYEYLDYQPTTNSFVTLGVTPDPVSYYCLNIPYLFSFNSNTWRAGAKRNFGGGGDCTGASSAYDPKRDVFWYLGGNSSEFAKYDPNANSGGGNWTSYGYSNISIDAISATDPVRDLFVTVDGRGAHKVVVRDLASPASAPVTVTTTGPSAIMDSKTSFEWNSKSQKFVGWAGGADVYTLTPPASAWRTTAWVWEKISAASGNTVTPTSPNSNGTYSRWRYASTVNAFVLINRTTDPVYMYKLTAGPGTAVEREKVAARGQALALAVNPLRTHAEIRFSRPLESARVSLWTPTGRRLRSARGYSGGSVPGWLDAAAPGLYLLSVEEEGERHVMRILLVP